jgi:hypothetical protein
VEDDVRELSQRANPVGGPGEVLGLGEVVVHHDAVDAGGDGRAQSAGRVLDDQSAIKVDNGTVEVVSEGNWKLLLP